MCKKTAVAVTLIFAISFSLSGCKKEKDTLWGYRASEYVDLCDYRNISVEKSYTMASDEEVKMVIEADLDSSGIYKEITNRTKVKKGDIVLCDIISKDGYVNETDYYFFTDDNEYSQEINEKMLTMNTGDILRFTSSDSNGKSVEYELHIKKLYSFAQADDEALVLDMYSCQNMLEVNDFVREKISRTIIFNYALDYIITSSNIKKLPVQAKQFVENNIKRDNINPDNIDESLGMNIEEYREVCYNTYFEYMIYYAIAENEGLLYSNEDLENAISTIAKREGLTIEKTKEIYDTEYLIYDMMIKDIEEKIISYVMIK